MEDLKKKFAEMKAEIEQLRDEVKLKAHLGKAEAKDELEKLEEKWDSFLANCKPLTDEIEQTAENTFTALGKAAEELKEGYERIRKLF